jgi:mRNA interferase YafQ
MYSIEFTNRFKKDVRRCQKRGYDLSILKNAIDLLQKSGRLPVTFKPHILKGKYEGLWECHLLPDWLLVWQQNDKELILLFMTTGTHSDLF